MKRIITIFAAILMTACVFAQSPNKMSYQAVIRNTSNALVTNSAVGMRISILQTTPSGTAVYVETQAPTTNANGLASIEIGGGTVVSGNFSTIDWANGPYFVKTETDPAGGTSYSITGTSQLLSVPYALHAKNTDSWIVNTDTTYTFKRVGVGTSTPNAPLSIFSNVGAPITLNRTANSANFGTSVNFNLWNSTNNLFRYGAITGGIKVNTSGTELGFISLMVANGDGVTDNFYNEEVLRATTEKVTIKDVLNIQPRATAPSLPSKGDLYFDNITNKLRVFDGTTWQNCW